MDYTNFKINVSNMNTLAPKLLEELELGAFQHLLLNDDDLVTVVLKDLSGNEKRNILTLAQAREGLKNSKMTDMVIWGSEMRFEFIMNGTKEYKELEASK